MAVNRRNFLKIAAGSGLLLAADAVPIQALADEKPLSPKAVGILYDATLCIGCKACMVNCKKYNQLPGGALSDLPAGDKPYEYGGPNNIYDMPQELSAKTLNIIKAYKSGTGLNKDRPENGFSFVKQHCMHCLDPACASVCPVAALKKDPASGVVTYDKTRCIGCRYCQTACPFGIPMFEWPTASPQIRKCQLCNHRMSEGKYAACCEFCPTGASIFGPVADLRAEAKKRMTLKPGDSYDYPVKTVDANFKLTRPVSGYINHIYGLKEAGGTQFLLLAGVPFDRLGFNPRITEECYPDRTWDYISHVPILIGLLLAAGTTSYYVTRDRKQNSESTPKK